MADYAQTHHALGESTQNQRKRYLSLGNVMMKLYTYESVEALAPPCDVMLLQRHRCDIKSR